MKEIFSKILNLILKIFPVQKNKVIFWGARGKIDEHPREIFFYIRNLQEKKFEIRWIVDKETDVSELRKEEYCYYRTLKGYYELATAKYWIQSQSLGSLVKKKKSQVYIQTFHGQGALKKMGIDMESNKEKKLESDVSKDWDWLITTDPLNEEVMRRCISYKGKCMMLGAANTDYLLNITEQNIIQIKKKLNIDLNKKVILYAPTFRDEDLKILTDMDHKKQQEILKERIPIFKLSKLDQYTILLRLHPQMRQVLTEIKLPYNFIDVCAYPDMKPLLVVSDILISDYSDIVIAYSVLERPMIFYAYDYEMYANTRGFYINYCEELPGPIVYSEDQLYKIIKEEVMYDKKYKEKLDRFNKKFNELNDGKVSERFYLALESGKFL